MKRRILLILAMIGVMFMLIGCSKKEGAAEGGSTGLPQIRYRHWYTEADPNNKKIYDYMQAWIDNNSDKVNIVQEISVGDESRVALALDVTSDSVPDTFNFWGNPRNAPMLVDADVIIDINEYFAVGKNKKADYDQDIFPRTAWNGVQTCIPLEGWSSYWFANKELFDKYNLKIPTTWDELKAVNEVFKKNGIITYAMGSKGGQPSYECFPEILNQVQGGAAGLRALPTSYTLDKASFTILLNRMAEMRDLGMWPQDTIGSGEWGAYLALYNQEKAAILQGYTWMLKDFNPALVSKTVKISPIKIPESTLDVDKYQRTGCDYGMMISKKAWSDPQRQSQLILLADFIGSEEYLLEKFYMNGEFPTRVGYFDKLDPSRITIPMMSEVIRDKGNRPLGGENFLWFPGNSTARVLEDVLDQFTAGTINGTQFMETLQEALDIAKEEA